MDEQNSGVTIIHEETAKGGLYTATVVGESAVGTLEWEPVSEGVRVATHTIVPRAIGGRGIAALLVERLINDAREHEFKVIPQCWYVAKKFDQNPEWGALRA